MRFVSLSENFGALIEGADLARLDAPRFRHLYELWQRHHLLLLRDHGLDAQGFEAFARRFGPGELLPDTGNAETAWGADLPWVERPPFAGLLHAREVPADGGASWFACLPAALHLIAPDLAMRLHWLAVRHGPNLHPLVIMQPETGEHSLFLGTRREARIADMPIAESERILNIVWSYGTADAVTWRHAWRPGDIVLWNNLTVMHRHEAVPAGLQRKLQRARVQGRYTLSAPIEKEAA
jgi:taurine dioxygenase